jgi:hypothetical protein
MRPQTIFGFVAVMVASVSMVGCYKKNGPAVVLEKEHIAAAEPSPTPAPGAEQSASPNSSTPIPGESPSEEVVYREMAEDEIDVDGYVMKKDVRGTGRDPRARPEEQWIIRVQMVTDLQRIKLQTDKAHWNKIKVGERINVSYRQGKYTGTVWAAEID